MSVSSFAYGCFKSSGGGETVSLNTSDVTRSTQINTCYANLQYNTSGVEYENSGYSDNFNTSRGNWLDSGSSSNVWLERTINFGTLYVDPGSGRLNMGTTRSFKERDTSPLIGFQETDMDIDMWNAASGGSTLDSVAGLLLRASYFESCPICCFTPDTLITMADGTKKPIGKVQVGEMISRQGGSDEAVEQIIEREKRPMIELTFEDGRKLVLSEDHPIYVKGKGRTAFNTEGYAGTYKGRTIRAGLEIGDYALTDAGILIKLVGIKAHKYSGKVYTFSNSRFYAGGIMVY